MTRPRSATYDDVFQAPENMVAELIDGELYTSPRPPPRYLNATAAIATYLMPAFDFRRVDGPGGWVILMEVELHLAGPPDPSRLVLVPDLAGWRRERMPEIPDAAGFEVSPDWVCEVVSPFTARLDRRHKLPRYAQAGVAHAWLVDPLAETLEVLRLEGGGWHLIGTYAGPEAVRAEPFEDVVLDLAALWAR